MESLAHATLNTAVVALSDRGGEPRPWSVQVKDQIRRRYTDLAEKGFRPGGEQRAMEAGYSCEKIGGQPRELVFAYSGCGNALQGLDLSNVRLVVDLGCGAGFDLGLLAESCPENSLVIGLDFTFSMLEKAKLNLNKKQHKKIRLALGDMEQLPFANNSVELILGNASFNLTLDKRLAFSEAARVLRPGGRLVIRDLIREGELPSDLQQDPCAWNTSVGGVLEEHVLKDAVATAGFEQIAISDHREFFPVIAIRLTARKPLEV